MKSWLLLLASLPLALLSFTPAPAVTAPTGPLDLVEHAIAHDLVIKLHDGLPVRMGDGVFEIEPVADPSAELAVLLADLSRELEQIQLLLDAHPLVAHLDPLFDAWSPARNAGCGDGLNLYGRIRLVRPLPEFIAIADLLQQLAVLPSVETVYAQGKVVAGPGSPAVSAVTRERTASFSIYSPHAQHPALDVAGAIWRASRWIFQHSRSGQGTILLRTELLREQPDGLRRLPVELEPAIFDAIRAATCLGISVVEPASDGGLDLDEEPLAGAFDRSQRDSEAIVVGAREAARAEVLAASNRGSRIDAFAIVDGLGHQGAEQASSAAAAAIVAEAITRLQDQRFGAGLPALQPAEIRDLLTTGAETDADSLSDQTGEEGDADAEETPEPPENAPPLAIDDEIVFGDDLETITVYHTELLKNDIDPEDQPLYLTRLVDGPQHGELKPIRGGFQYRPGETFDDHGSDFFTYAVSDGFDLRSHEATATVVLRLNRQPEAGDDRFAIPPGAERVAMRFRDLLKNDKDPDGDALLIVESMSVKPRRGDFEIARGRFYYRPGSDFWSSCQDRFTYFISDRDDRSSAPRPATVTLTCDESGEPPTAQGAETTVLKPI